MGKSIFPIKKCFIIFIWWRNIFYDYKTKQTKNKIQIKNYLDISETNSISNPPYLNKVILNKDNDEIICGMMNGYIIGLKSDLKKMNMKNIHNGYINDIKISKFKVHDYKEIITYRRDKFLKFIVPQNNFNIDYYIEMTCNIIDFDSDIHRNVFYIDDNSKMLYMMKFK